MGKVLYGFMIECLKILNIEIRLSYVEIMHTDFFIMSKPITIVHIENTCKSYLSPWKLILNI